MTRLIQLPESKSRRYYLYLDASGDFEEQNDEKDLSLIAGVLCYDEEKALMAAEDIISKVREKILQRYPSYANFNFYHATEFPNDSQEEKQLKSEIKLSMLETIIKNDYGFIPIVFRQSTRVSIQDSTTTYIMFLVDGLVKLIQDCSFQTNFNLVVTLGGRRDRTREEQHARRNSQRDTRLYISGTEIRREFDKYMTMAQVREQYSFKNKFTVTFKTDDDHKNKLLILGDYISNSILTQKTFLGNLKARYQKFFKKCHVYSIAEEPNVERLKRYMSDGSYSMALFYAMNMDQTVEGYKTFCENFKFSLKNMPSSELRLVLTNYGHLLKRLLEVNRSSDEVIELIDNTMNFIGGDRDCLGECYNEFIADLYLYKMTAITHLGKVKQFVNVSAKCLPHIRESGNLKLYIIYVNRQIVHLQDMFQFEESFALGNEVVELMESFINPLNKFNEMKQTKFTIYSDQYFRICGSLALTGYFTLNKSHEHLALTRKYSDISISGFNKLNDKRRQYQIRAQIEAEVDNFQTACEMLDLGLNITINNPQEEQFKNFSAFDWYHFSKFVERLLKSNDEQYFEIAKAAILIAKPAFLNYRDKIKNKIEHPDYITFCNLGVCFDILGESSFALNLQEEALNGVDNEIGEDFIKNEKTISAISVNSNSAAFRLVILAHLLMTCERNNLNKKSATIKEKFKNKLTEYLSNDYVIDSMKTPFKDWQEIIEHIESNENNKLKLIEEMSRAILI